MNLTHYVKTFLLENGIVEISGLGVFQTQYVAPHFNEEKRVFSAPRREVSFSKQQMGNTDIIRFIAEKECVSLKIAAKFWEAYSQALIDKLQTDKKFEFEGLGILEQQEDGEYLFTPDKDLALLDSAFGLEDLEDVQTFVPQNTPIKEESVVMPAGEPIIEIPVSEAKEVVEPTIETVTQLPQNEQFKETTVNQIKEEKPIDQPVTSDTQETIEEPVAVENNEEKEPDVNIEMKNQVTVKKNKTKRWILRIILALIVLCALYCCYLYYMKYEKNKVESTSSQSIVAADTTASNTTSVIDTTTLPQTYDTNITAAQSETAEMLEGIEFVQNSRKGIDIIAGFFKVKENALKQAKQMKTAGFEPYIIKEEKTGKEQYYVSIGSFDKKNDAINFMRTTYKDKKIELVLKNWTK